MQEFLYAVLFGSLATNAVAFAVLMSLVFYGTMKSVADSQTYEILSKTKPLTPGEVVRLAREAADTDVH